MAMAVTAWPETHLGQPGVFLVVCSKGGDVGHHHVAVKGRGQARVKGAGKLFRHHDGIQKITLQAPVFPFHPGAQEPGFSHFSPYGLGHDPIFFPLGDKRDDLLGKKVGQSFPERFMGPGVFQDVHKSHPKAWKIASKKSKKMTSGRKSCNPSFVFIRGGTGFSGLKDIPAPGPNHTRVSCFLSRTIAGRGPRRSQAKQGGNHGVFSRAAGLFSGYKQVHRVPHLRHRLHGQAPPAGRGPVAAGGGATAPGPGG